jgi:DNA repair protein RadC
MSRPASAPRALRPAAEDRPRSPKSGTQPLSALDDAALLALWLGRWEPDPESAAARLVARFDGLGGAVGADRPALARATALSEAALEDVALLRELAARLAREAAARRPVISAWSALQAYARTVQANAPREQFRVLFLDHRNHLMVDEILAEGSVSHAPVYPREVVRFALEISASSMILVHNHPSGDPSPSQADIAMTRQVVEAARALGLQVHDHIIVGRNGTASFRAMGLM